MEFKKRVIEAMTSGLEIKTSYIDRIETHGLLYKRPEILNHLSEDVLKNILHYGNLGLCQLVANSHGGYMILRKLAIPTDQLTSIQIYEAVDVTGIIVNLSDIIHERDRSTMENVFDNNHLTKHTATRLFVTMSVLLLFNVSNDRAIDGINFFLIQDMDKFNMDNISDNLRKLFEISELPDHSIFEN